MKMKPLIVSGGLVCGHTIHLLDVHKGFVDAQIISADEKIDFIIHTWDIHFNQKYVNSLKRYEHKFNFNIIVENYEKDFLPIVGMLIHPDEIKQGHWKTFLLAYSLWKVFNSINTIDDYDLILKYKMDVLSTALPWGVKDNVQEHFKRMSIFSHPRLYNYSFTDCLFSNHVHQGFDERHFVTFAKPIKKLFLKKPVLNFLEELKQICLDLYREYGINIEYDVPWRVQGTAMWGELLNRHDIPFVNVPNQYNGRSRGKITPQFVVDYVDKSYIIKDKDNYKYTPWNELT